MIGVPTQQSVQIGKALPVQVSHSFTLDSAVFDDDNLVSLAGLVPVMTLAEQTALPELLADRVYIAEPKIKSGSANRRRSWSRSSRGCARARTASTISTCCARVA